MRSSTVEPVLGTLLNFLNMRRENTQGLELANKHVLMAALSYNLKKYLKYTKKPTAANVILIPMWETRALFLCFFYYFWTECNHIVKYFIEYRIIYFRSWKK